jgi:hypothetical protein
LVKGQAVNILDHTLYVKKYSILPFVKCPVWADITKYINWVTYKQQKLASHGSEISWLEVQHQGANRFSVW